MFVQVAVIPVARRIIRHCRNQFLRPFDIIEVNIPGLFIQHNSDMHITRSRPSPLWPILHNTPPQ